MVKSLLNEDKNAFIYIFAFDDECFKSLMQLSLPRVKVISLGDFENERLISIKTSRTAGEYCWTCTPWIMKYSIENFALDHCIYVDADLYFFSNPQPLIDELGLSSVLLTEHRYSPKYDQTKTSGRFCVQFLIIKNNDDGMSALNWWAERCIEWCYARTENGKFGDQMYLDDWETRFSSVHVLKHLGGGVAPWNLEKYNLKSNEGNNFIFEDSETGILFSAIFYHFHEVKLNESSLTLKLNYFLPSRSFKLHTMYFKSLKENFEIFIGEKIKSERYSGLIDILLENIYLERTDMQKMYSLGKRRLIKYWMYSFLGGILVLFLLLALEYFLLVSP
ncbi:hypothetical protein P3G55_04380 [Leptospira sp. 96542]|nr:hypothetical protein [Leptospira sp. 96542]